MKKLLSFLLILVLGLFIVGCETNTNPPKDNDKEQEGEIIEGDKDKDKDKDKDDDNVITISLKENSKVVYSDAFKNYELKYSQDEVEKKKEEVLDKIKNATKLADLYDIYDDYNNYVNTLQERFSVVSALSDADASNEAVVNGYYDIYKLLLDADIVYDDIDKEIAKGPFAKEYFSDYTDEEIEAIINSESTNEELNALLIRKEEIKDEMGNAKSREKDKLLKEFININKEAGTYLGYDKYGYIEYSDTNNYYRLYSEEDIKRIEELTLKYLLEIDDELYYNGYETDDDEEFDTALNLQYNSFTDYQELIENYAKFVGGDFLDTYNNLLNNGYYIISNDITNGNDTAYQDAGGNVKLVFFGPYYQDSSTFVHEFGHYYTSNLGTDSYSYDLCEVHSQADEALFRLYLLSLDNSYAYKWYERQFVSYMLDTVLCGLMIREFEETVYSTDVTSLQDTWDAINDKYGSLCSDDFYELITDYDNYYISYTTSAICALELYAYGKTEGLEKAKEAYLAICGYNGEGDIVEAMTNAGISEPFGEETILNLVSVITYEMENNWK